MGKIEWCDLTVNPIVGCSKCSPGCANCYAERFAARLSRNPFTMLRYEGVACSGKWAGKINYNPRWHRNLPHKAKRIFLGSMSDIFHPALLHEYLVDILVHVEEAGKNFGHTFCLLTKRIEHANEILGKMPLPQNIWLGATVCTQEEADRNIPALLDIPATKHFISIEPMLEYIDIRKHLEGDAESFHRRSLDWVICGGETGPKARPVHPDWARFLKEQCERNGTPFFFKNWGEWLPCSQMPDDFDIGNLVEGDIGDDGIFTPPPALEVRFRNMVSHEQTFRFRDKTMSRLLDGVEYSQMPAA